MSVPATCPSCGARLAPGAEHCDLCGTSVLATDDVSASEAAPPGVEAAPGMEAADAGGVFCNQCGWENPAGARFCSQCGAPLQVDARAAKPLPPRPPRSPRQPALQAEAPQKGVGTSIAVLFGAALTLVVALYLVSYVSKQRTMVRAATQPQEQPAIPAPASQAPPPAIAEDAARLQDAIAGLDGEAKAERQAELVALYARAGRFDLAGDVQRDLATLRDTEEEWTRAGNLYYDWMETREQATPEKAYFAQQAIAAYKRVLELNPDNLDVRTDMATAYLYDPQNPMEAIRHTNEVLERDSLHIQANFNRGIMLMTINRTDQAVEQFEKVKRIVGDANDPVYQRADAVIETIRDVASRPQAAAPTRTQ